MIKLKEHVVTKARDYGIELSTGYNDDYPHRKPSNSLHINFLHHSWWFQVPQIIKPKKVWIDLSDRDWATENEDGVKGYFDNITRSYGIHTFEDSIHIHYGIQPGQWISNDKKNSDHVMILDIPWLTKRYIGITFYDVIDQKLLKTFPENRRSNGLSKYEEERDFRDLLRKLKVTFNDFDGEKIVALCHIEEREWRHGIGAFKWLSWFIKPTIRRSLDIAFDKETGYEKGSWKGGTVSSSINMMKGESAESAFLRYATATDRYRNHGEKPRNFTNVEIHYED